MPSPIIALAGASVGSSLVGAKAASSAASAETEAQYASIAEQRRQFDKVQGLLEPYVANGRAGMSEMINMLGLRGNEAQQQSITGIQEGAAYQTALAQGENAILQNASATGGLRGGNTQAALGQYAPQLLNSMVQQQYGNLSGLAAMGQNAAAGTGVAAQSMANNISGAYSNIGQAQADRAVSTGNAINSGIGNISGLYGAYLQNPSLMGGSLF